MLCSGVRNEKREKGSVELEFEIKNKGDKMAATLNLVIELHYGSRNNNKKFPSLRMSNQKNMLCFITESPRDSGE